MSASPGSESRRVAEARERAHRRLVRQRSALRPVGLVAIAAVAAGTVGAHPGPGLHGKGLGVTIALCGSVATIAVAIRDFFVDLPDAVQVAVISAMGACGVALAALQPRGASELAAAMAVWMAVARLPLAAGVAVAAAVTIALEVAVALADGSSATLLAAPLLCVLLGFVAYFVKRMRESQEGTELLLAQLEDARDEQARAAAIAERGRIASELHDVLAHSLSGAAIQLQGARLLADREEAGSEMRDAIDRASELVKDGLANARQAVGALRGDQLPTVAELDSLVESFRRDLNVDATLTIEGSQRLLPADASVALYRGAQEALTNVARYAPGATTTLVLRYESGHTTLSVENRMPATSSTQPAGDGLPDVGGGRGLAGMRERVERAGGHMQAGPIGDGWRVELDVPA